MHTKTIACLLILIALLLNSCGNSNVDHQSADRAESAAATHETAEDVTGDNSSIVSSYIAKAGTDSTKKIIKTADLKFKSKDAVKTTYNIEDLVRANGGFVESSEISKTQQDEKLVQTTRDSALQIIHYVLQSNVTLRVPQYNLDTLLKQISNHIDFLESRNLTAEDATLKYFAEELRQKRASSSQNRIDSLQGGKRGDLSDNVSAENARYNRQLSADEALLNKMQLDDKVNYSTVHLHIFQDKKEFKTTVPFVKSINTYKPDFGLRFIDALKTGWHLFLEFVLILTRLWWLLFVAIGIWLVVKMLQKISRKKRL